MAREGTEGSGAMELLIECIYCADFKKSGGGIQNLLRQNKYKGMLNKVDKKECRKSSRERRIV